jgi:hypothetical protein
MRLYIAVLDEFPDYMVPTLVAHTMLSAHLKFAGNADYDRWLTTSYRKCVVRVNEREFQKICALPGVYVGYEKHTLGARNSCAIPIPCENDDVPNVLKFAKLWKPLNEALDRRPENTTG